MAWLIVLGSGLGAWLLTPPVRNLMLGCGLLDVPNPRSSHRVPTARGGGVAIVVVTTLAVLTLTYSGFLETVQCVVIVAGGAAVAAVGLADDYRPLPSSLRLAVHFCAAIWAVFWLGGLPAVRIGEHLFQLGWAGDLLAVLAIVWSVNLFNFMDGVDGIASSEAVFVALAGAWLTARPAWTGREALLDLVVAAASGGFLLWNWPPARIFMGDVGSGYLGYLMAVLALSAARTDPAAPWVWLILGGAFLVDATVTLLRRAARREPLHQAHRSHAYQWLARRWESHRRVSVAFLLLNVGWLLPWAVWAARRPAFGAAAVVGALVPLGVLALAAGSGRSEGGPVVSS